MLTPEADASLPARAPDPGEIEVAFAALTRMIGLLGAELLVGRYREDIDVFEACVWTKLNADVRGVAPEAAAAGVARAQALIEPVLRNLRARVEAMRTAEAAISPPSLTRSA